MQGNSKPEEKIVWSALEYEEKERSDDWFWALGIIVVTGSIASIIFENYFFAILLILSGVLLGFFALKKPDHVIYELNSKGLLIHNHLYPYDNIKSFWVQADLTPGASVKPALFVHSRRAVMPVFSVPITNEIAPIIHSRMLAKGVPEEEMREHPSERIMDILGF